MHSMLLYRALMLSIFVLIAGTALGQGDSTNTWYAEVHIAAIGTFGPSGSQAEIAGGVGPSYWYDGKQHLSPGFSTSTAAELTGGFRHNLFSYEGTLSTYRQDLGLIPTIASSSDGPKLATASMLSARLAVLMQLSDVTKNQGYYGFKFGLFISTTSAVSSQITDEARTTYGISDIQSAVQFNWGSEFKYVVRIGRQGLYATAMFSITFPGTIGSIGKLEMQPGAAYSLVRDEIKAYHVRGAVGIGYRFAGR